jgi:hypothetical protein
VGVTGPLTKLGTNIMLVHLVAALVLGFGIWLPFSIGKTTNFIFTELVIPTLQEYSDYLLVRLQELSDPLTEPIADFILFFVNSTINTLGNNTLNATVSNATESVVNATTKEAPLLNTILKVLGVLNSTETHVQYGPYNPNFFQSLHEDMTYVLLGYIITAILFLLYAVTSN